jgi:hypothetical protein
MVSGTPPVNKGARYLSPDAWLAQNLREQIVAGVYAPNAFLPSERAMAEEFGVSRTHVRQALAQLEKENLLMRRHGRGTVVVSVPGRAKSRRVGILGTRSRLWLAAEGLRLLENITRRLLAHGYAYERIAYAASRQEADAGPTEAGERLHDVGDLVALSKEFDGLAFIEAPPHSAYQALIEIERQHYPIVVVNLEHALDWPFSATRVNHAKLMQRSVEILVGYGHRRIAFVGQDPSQYFFGRALEGFRRGMEAAGLQAQDDLIVLAKASTSLAAYLGFKPLLARMDRPTGVVAARDYMAHGVCQAVEESGLEVGRDVSVIGYDNLSWEMESPFLATFQEPCLELATTAVDMLVERMTTGGRPPEQLEIEAPLILRRSVGPILDRVASAPMP